MSDAFIWASKGAKSAMPLLSEALDISPLGGSHNVKRLGTDVPCQAVHWHCCYSDSSQRQFKPFGQTDGGIRK